MKLAYCTNIWNHHQGPVCAELAKRLGPKDFRLLLYQPLDHQYSLARINMGWNLNPPDEPWIVGPPKSCADVDYREQADIARTCDTLVYMSSVPYVTQELLLERRRNGKISMLMGERLYKVKRPWYYSILPRKIAGRCIVHHRFESTGVHFLTMGHGCVEDLAWLHVGRGRTWRWGYLTPASTEVCEKPMRDKVRVGWCGRMIDWKQVDLIIKAVAMLSDETRSKIKVTLVGNGDQECLLRRMVEECRLGEVIEFRDSMSANDVLDFMRGLDVYVFPSNRKEGWGAALLEAMDKGCVPIANASAGSTLEVVKDGHNGFVFKDGDIQALSEKIEYLALHPKEMHAMGQCAWRTIQFWTPQVGAERLCALIEAIGKKTASPFQEGLCAKVR